MISKIMGWMDTVATYVGIKKRFRIGQHHFKVYGLSSAKEDLSAQEGLVFLSKSLGPGSVLLDSGAHKGVWSIALAFAQPCSIVVAVEPNPITYAKMLANLRLNTNVAHRIRPLACGLGERDEILKFQATWIDALSGFSPSQTAVRKIFDVPVRTLDGLIERGEIPPPTHWKLDTEGFEHFALRGARETLLKHRPIIYVEPHPISDGRNNRALIEETLAAADYIVEPMGSALLGLSRNGHTKVPH